MVGGIFKAVLKALDNIVREIFFIVLAVKKSKVMASQTAVGRSALVLTRDGTTRFSFFHGGGGRDCSGLCSSSY